MPINDIVGGTTAGAGSTTIAGSCRTCIFAVSSIAGIGGVGEATIGEASGAAGPAARGDSLIIGLMVTSTSCSGNEPTAGRVIG